MLTVEDIEAMRVKVAEKLGWRQMFYTRDGLLAGHPPGRTDTKKVPSYATDVKAAWEILELLSSMRIRVTVSNVVLKGCYTTYRITLGEDDALLAEVSHPSFPYAICQAYLELPVNGETKLSGDFRIPESHAEARHRIPSRHST